jgi:uncharacterized protein (DUF1330 family)
MSRKHVGARAGWCLGVFLLIAGAFVSGQPLDRLTPTPDDLERLRVSVDPGPVVLVNLLKFRADGGREAYQRYGAIAGPLFRRAGAEIIYAGTAGPLVAEGQDWDEVILARFDSIDRFIEMAGDPRYQTEARHEREAALERTLWMVSQPSATR